MLKIGVFLVLVCLDIVNGQASPLANAKFNVNIKGTLKCAEYPAATVRVRLWKNDEKSVLDETYVDKTGDFKLTGSTSSSDFNPIVVIYHDCNDGVKPGQRKLKFQIPKHYITFGEGNEKVFNLGSFNLETVMKYNEERQQYVDKRRRRTLKHQGTPIRLRKTKEIVIEKNGFNGKDEEIDERNSEW